MQPTFLITFDCEGKWGFGGAVDEQRLSPFTNARLNETYRTLVELLDKYEIRATFAFVGAFIMSHDEYEQQQELFRDVPIAGVNWLKSFRDEIARGHVDGWFNPDVLEIVKGRGVHEIASHGFTHVPLAETQITEADFLHEMNAVQKVATLKELRFSSFVYPRNLVGYTNLLAQYGFDGFRDGHRQTKSTAARVISLLSEFDIFRRGEAALSSHAVARLPAGFFLNWRVGLRRFVPPAITVRSVANAVRDAINHSTTVHLWTHPHNFITGESQFELFERVLQKVSPAIRRGEISNATQTELCRSLLAQASSG
ncbi:MAG: polysaccharide deacetylase family protein [Candidatus Krumholzibacteria bacterium]|nr:polysaccharide deacetylase family protein [Candidatus Krumholzibacteria bacterium]MCK5405970.1 polysaccharide deacetylase family protein [Candidatus Krumholzibacteria bacterium]